MNPTLKQYLPYALIAALIFIGYKLWDHFTPPPAPVSHYVPATAAPQLALIPQTTLQPKAVKVYAQLAKAALKLPPAMQADPNLYALSATKIKPDLHPQTVVTTLNAETGETETIIRRDPLPWLAPEQTGEIRLDYGYKNTPSFAKEGWGGFDNVARLTLREDLLQIKALHAGINASIDSDGQMFAGVGVGWKW